MPFRRKRNQPSAKLSESRKRKQSTEQGISTALNGNLTPAKDPSLATKTGLRPRPAAKLVQSSAKASAAARGSAPIRGTRAGLRSSENFIETSLPNPLSHRKIPKSSPAKDRVAPLTVEALEKSLQGVGHRSHKTYSDLREDSLEATASDAEEQDPEEAFNRQWGYLPPLDEEAAAILDAVIADPSMAKFMNRKGPETKYFPIGLMDRNVFLEASEVPDLLEGYIRDISSEKDLEETQEEEAAYTRLWNLDQVKCNKPSNEALFQRTLMVSLIARHCLIYNRDGAGQQILDFNVEEPWNCPPMPTRSYWQSSKPTPGTFLTQPKPDLAICFDRKAIIDNDAWNLLPTATKRLICYENADPLAGITRAFHFLTVEAKKAMTPINDSKAFYQSLNNASQALHNMFEFLKDAGPQFEMEFFTKVRFFSVVASSEGLTIRIHRATEIPTDAPSGRFVMPLERGYALQFENRVFAKIIKDTDYNRKTVLANFQKISLYAVSELRPLLRNAALALVERLGNDTEEFVARSDPGFYRYGQTGYELQSNKVQSNGIRSPSLQNLNSITDWQQKLPKNSTNQTQSLVDQSMRSGTTTPTQGRQPKANTHSTTTRKRDVRQAVLDEPTETTNPAGTAHKRKRKPRS